MALTGDERRRWQELTRQLRRDRRLTAHSMRFRVVSGWRREMANARARTAVSAITWVPATVVACLGLILVGVGEYYRDGTVVPIMISAVPASIRVVTRSQAPARTTVLSR